MSDLKTRVASAIELVQNLRPVRVWTHLSERRGLILAGGLSYQALFAVFAAVWVGFAAGGLVLRANPALADAFFDLIAASAPGLISWNGSEGIIEPARLLELEILGVTGVIAAAALAFTALAWLASAREALRAIFDLPAPQTNFLLLKLKDVGIGIGFGIALLVSAALSVFSTQALSVVLDWTGIGSDSTVATVLGRVLGLVLMFLIDAAMLAGLFRILSGLVIPARRLLTGVLLGAVGLGALKVLGNVLLGGASRNPLLASFAVLIGLLIWFNLVCTVILLSASWVAVGMADAGLVADPVVARERAEERRREQEELQRALEARLAAERDRGNWFTRLWRRRAAAPPR